MPPLWLGLDIGTSAVKALLLEGDAVVARGHSPLGVSRPRPLWSEQRPEDWWTGVVAAVGALPAELRTRVAGVGLAGQMHGAVALDAAGAVLRPAMLWNDGRSHAECAALDDDAARAITANKAMPGFTAPKLAWLAAHEPALFARVARVLLPKDWVRLRLTGVAATDMSDASGTLWLDVARRDWSPAMLARTGLTPAAMPALFEGTAITGALLPAVAARLGLPVVPVAAGGGDNAAGAVGVGAIRAGEGFVSLGTSGVLFVVTDGVAAAPARGVHAFVHALPGRWHAMAVALSAASALDWAAGVTGLPDAGAAAAAADALGDAAPLPLFAPYLTGERTPHDDPRATAAWVGLTADHTPAHLARAVLEGVAFALADGGEALRDAGAPFAELTLIGGGARSALWARILATALGVAIVTRADADNAVAIGAARLARLAVTAASPDELRPPVETARFAPDVALAARMAPRRAAHRRLAAALKGLRC